MKNETLQQLRILLIKNIERQGTLEKLSLEELTNLLDELLEIVHSELEKGKTFDEIKRTIVDFFTKKKSEMVA